MANKPAKKVELTELFYDLVFVYAVSRSTDLIHHFHSANLDPFIFFVFVIAFVILINSWMFEMVFINRYGESGVRNNVILFVQMGLVLILANSMQTNWEETFVPFTVSAGLLSVVLTVQYAFVFFETDNENDKRVAKLFLTILSLRSALLLSSLAFPHQAGAIVSLAAIITGILLPAVFSKHMRIRPVDFHHLTERLSLLTIIIFGEMVVGIAVYFEWQSIDTATVFVLLTVFSMFFLYMLQFDNAVDRHIENITGVAMIYLHYPIFFGIIMVNVAFAYLLNPLSSHIFDVTFLYIGMTLYVVGVLLGGLYVRDEGTIKRNAVLWLPILIGGYLSSLLVAISSDAVNVITGVMLSAAALLTYLSSKRTKVVE